MRDVLSILRELNVPYAENHHHSTVGWVQINCPFCSNRNSNSFRLGINLEGAYCNCWHCGGKRLVDVLVEITQQPYHSIQDLLKGISRQTTEKKPKITGKLEIPFGVEVMGKPHRSYLKNKRKLDPDEIERVWGVKGIGVGVDLSWRLWIPVHYRNEIVSWTTRSIGNSDRDRYICAAKEKESIPAKSLLYGSDFARHAIVIVEGPIDAWSIGPGCVSTLGTSYSKSQVLKMASYPIRAICFDTEPSAQHRAQSLAKELQSHPGETFVIELESGKDANAADKSEILEIRHRFLE